MSACSLPVFCLSELFLVVRLGPGRNEGPARAAAALWARSLQVDRFRPPFGQSEGVVERAAVLPSSSTR